MRVRIKKVPKEEGNLQTLWGGNLKPLSFNPYGGETVEFKGNSHEQKNAGGNTGIGITWKSTPVEVENNETGHVDDSGNLIIGGNLTALGTKKKYKDIFKDISRQEVKVEKQMAKATELLDKYVPDNSLKGLVHNSAFIKAKGADLKFRNLKEERDYNTAEQNMQLDLAAQLSMEPRLLNTTLTKAKFGAIIPQAKNGKNVDGTTPHKGDVRTKEINQVIDNVAARYDIFPNILHKLIRTESNYNPKARSGKGALGIMQFMPETAKEYGITKKQLLSDDPADIAAVIDAGGQHIKKLMNKYNNDYAMTLIAYNGGEGAIDGGKMNNGKYFEGYRKQLARETGKKPEEIKGWDILDYWGEKRDTKPSKDPGAWQNQTYDYTMGILSPVADPVKFRKDYNYNVDMRGEVLKDQPKAAVKPNPEVPTYTDDSDWTFVKQPLDKITPDTPWGMTPMENNITGRSAITQSMDYNRDWKEQMADMAAKETSALKPIGKRGRNTLGLGEILPELMALADKPDFVQHQRYEPSLFTPYQVSFQDRLNENQATFRGIEQQLSNNPAALSVLAASKYGADNQVMGEQFRVNQSINNDVINKNVSLMNDAELKNLALNDQQFVRQTQAKANTRNRKWDALNSITSKIQQNRTANNSLDLYDKELALKEKAFDYYKNLYNYTPDETGKLIYTGPNAVYSPGVSSTYGDVDKLQVRTKDGNTTTTSTYDPDDDEVVVKARNGLLVKYSKFIHPVK